MVKMMLLIHSKRYNSTLKWLIYFPVTFFSHNNVLKLQILICTNSYFLRKICTVLQHNECGICNNLLANFNIHDTATFYLPVHRFKDVTTALLFCTLLPRGGVGFLGFCVFFKFFLRYTMQAFIFTS